MCVVRIRMCSVDTVCGLLVVRICGLLGVRVCVV